MKIQLKRSLQKEADGSAKAPLASQMEYGELAVNYCADDPAIFLENENNQIIRIAGAGAVGAPETPADIGANLQAVTDVGNNTTNGITIDTDKIALKADGSATFAGNLTAGEFIGDGSKLTNLPEPLGPIQGIIPPVITYANADWSPGAKLSVETKGFCPGQNTTSTCQWMRDYVDIPGATSCMGWTQTSTKGAYQLKILWTDRDTGQTGLAISNVIDVGGTPPSLELPDFRDLPALT